MFNWTRATPLAARAGLVVLGAFLSILLIGCAPTASVKVANSAPFDEMQNIAVLNFVDAPGADAGHSGEVVSNAVMHHALGVERWTLVERKRINDILAEHAIQRSGRIDERTAVELGRLLGAQGVIVGAVSQYRINAVPLLGPAAAESKEVGFNFRLLDVKTGQVCISASASASSNNSMEDAAGIAVDLVFQQIKPHVQRRRPLGQTVCTSNIDATWSVRRSGSVAWVALGNGTRIVADTMGGCTVRAEAPGYLPSERDLSANSPGRQRFELVPLTSVASQPPLSKAGQRWAIIVGIAQYEHAENSGLTNLTFADSDARDMAARLKDMGWDESHIKLLSNKDATKSKIEIALESWLTKAGPDDLIVLFWSGHGYPDVEDPEKVYFACYDTDPKVPSTGYRMDRVRATIEERKAKNVIVLADTCHAGRIITRGVGDKAISVEPYVKAIKKEDKVPKGWVFMVASDTDRKAIENSSWKHGAFTHCLLEGLAGKADGFEGAGAKDGIVTLGELKAYLTSAMPTKTQEVLGVAKHPVIATSSGDQAIWNLTLGGK